jgi:hypothetical protein
VRDAITAGLLGAMSTPGQGNRIEPGWAWARDNGCFGKGWPGEGSFITWLAAHDPAGCLFAVAPDVVGDARATLKRGAHLLPVIRELGYPAAFVLQNGVHAGIVPWDDLDVVFIGGDDDFKTSTEARRMADRARELGKRVHWGRANGLWRLIRANSMGCDTADGRTLALYPQTLAPMLRWLDDSRVRQGLLW